MLDNNVTDESDANMAYILALPPKFLRLIQTAIKRRIASEEARYRVDDAADDETGDFGNDLMILKMCDEQFERLHTEGRHGGKHFNAGPIRQTEV